jgi:hypothetical protein
LDKIILFLFFILFNDLYYFLIFFLLNASVCIEIDSWLIGTISIHNVSIVSNCLVQYFILSFIAFDFNLMVDLLLQRKIVIDIIFYHVLFQLHPCDYFTVLSDSAISDIRLKIASFVLLAAWIYEGKGLLELWWIYVIVRRWFHTLSF